MMESIAENTRYRDWRLFRRILEHLRPYGPLTALTVAALFCASALHLAGPYLTKIAIDDHIRAGNLSGLDRIALSYAAVLAAIFAAQFLQAFLTQYIGQRVMLDLRLAVFSHLHKMPFRFFDSNPIGKMTTRVVNDVEVLGEMLTSGLILVFHDLFTLSGIFIMLFYLDRRLALLVCCVLPVLLKATQIYRRLARDAFRKNRAHVSTLSAFLQESLSGMSTVQTLTHEEARRRNFQQINADKLREDLRTLHYNSVYLPSIDVFSALGIGLVIWYGGGRHVSGEIQLGTLVAFLQYLQKFFEPIRDLAEKFNIIQSAMASSERVFELLDTPEEMPPLAAPAPITALSGRTEFKNVWLAYRDENYILKDVSFNVEPGESLAIVGATGSGKTTIINALCRFYDIQKGDILLDGISIKDLDKRHLRRHIALVQQDPFLFSGNILDNIRLGSPEMELEYVEAIARNVQLHEFIETLPDKYRQEVLEKGSSLSMGQRQLLTFARALAIDPKILILDEATANVDLGTERLIQEAMRKLVAGRTSIIIAHRLSTLKHVDKVLVLQNGAVCEFGKREDLLRQQGIYYNLARLNTEASGTRA